MGERGVDVRMRDMGWSMRRGERGRLVKQGVKVKEVNYLKVMLVTAHVCSVGCLWMPRHGNRRRLQMSASCLHGHDMSALGM